MTLELIPKSKLPEWNDEDEKRKNDFEDRLESGRLHLVSAKKPENF